MALERMDPSTLLSAVQQAGESWTPGITSVSELSDQEKRLRLGAVPPPVELSLEAREQLATANLAATMITAAGAPAAYDLRNVGGQNFITSVKDQVTLTSQFAGKQPLTRRPAPGHPDPCRGVRGRRTIRPRAAIGQRVPAIRTVSLQPLWHCLAVDLEPGGHSATGSPAIIA